MTDYRRKATAADGTMRIIVANTKDTALQVQRVHQASPVAAAAMGRLLTAAALLAADFKDAALVKVEVDGGGPLGRVIAEARTGGRVRARAEHPQVTLPLRNDGKLAVGQAVGTDGVFKVTREEHNGLIYQGQVELLSGEIGQDFAQYYTLSEQIPSAVALGVLVGTDSLVQAAGGLVVQALPGSEPYIDGVSARFAHLDHISHRLADGESVEQLAEEVMGTPLHWYDPEPIYYQCECSKTRSLELLSSLPRVEIEELIKDQGAEVVCHYCHTAYQFSQSDIEKLLDRAID
ncbi:molecular chaperone Hsp33 [Sulfobacillus thermosulfidooxidans DSM 9293]|uniref:33 kDa chaperonin n=1 Tax=Sulfobacillus thermosulfidooxidans (strain DSM 9293 / VKM B-1269 / AT-1) TaxID=929705 RepID=A0A1W1WMV4_SULTA|nr:Hsp33 family molecular chaperone HslO [Sulfobacillus thermosulfidooxidans]SMC07499.1 molecular chaperone Hsp33 [Sulfobacillus thermosulfidooxidans DSM 9293]